MERRKTKNGKDRDPKGYDFEGLDENGFGRDGCYYEKQEDGTYKKTDLKFGKDGYNRYGLDKFGFSKKNGLYYGIDETGNKKNEKGSKRDPEGYNSYGIDEYQFGRNGTYYERQEDGTWKDTGRLFNNEGLDVDGYYWEEQEDGTFVKTYLKFGKDGYSLYGLDKFGFSKKDKLYYGIDETGNKKNLRGHDRDPKGYNFYGIDTNGFERESKYYYIRRSDGTWENTGRLLNNQGFDVEGYYWEEQEDGTYKKTDSKFGKDGYNLYGLDKFGFSQKDKLYYGIDETGNKKNSRGHARDPKGYNFYGIDTNGFERESKYYYIRRLDGTWENTGRLLNNQGFNAEGYYWKKQEDGTYRNTGYKYNEFGFQLDRRHRITKSYTDPRGFEITGICKTNNDKMYDRNGFRMDGTHYITGELYYKGYNAYGVDINGKNKLGKEPIEITFTKEYVLGISKDTIREVLKKYDIKKMEDLNRMLYIGTEMFPELKKVICTEIMRYQTMIQQRIEKIQQLESKKAENMSEIEKLRKENAVLRQRISNLNPMQDLEKE